ncbi:hypothetical protein E2I00_019336 [Balaenoptera physalus]|uniref:Solute carrier organic anion transporter family member n=1 Tax=Balaenoptera physalus TaxID=9770 RepID=A0A643C3G6_BALPH|nr:hypothetical protein E2I00_019336 [Balaenoptera physalus]
MKEIKIYHYKKTESDCMVYINTIFMLSTRYSRKTFTYQDSNEQRSVNEYYNMKELCDYKGPNEYEILIKNPMFVYLSLSRASESLVMIGASEFLPIYIENQFILTPSEATTLAGCTYSKTLKNHKVEIIYTTITIVNLKIGNVSVSSTNPLREGSPPQEPQKSPEPPLSSVTPPGSQERSGPESLSEYEEGPCGLADSIPTKKMSGAFLREPFAGGAVVRIWEVEPGEENYNHFLGREKERLLFIKVSHLKVPDADTCLTAKNKTSCTASSSSLFYYLYVFILGQLLLGTGGTPLYTLGTAFIDDSVPTHKSSLYIALISLSMIRDGWGHGTAEIQDGKTSQIHQSNSLQHTDGNFGQSFKDFPAALKNLMRNTVFMCLVLSTCSEALVTTGFATFLPKFIENQFGLSSSSAATLAGTVLIPGAALGQILGGVLVSKFKMTCKSIMKFALLTSITALALTFVFVYASCENEPFAGVSESYNGTGELGNLTAPCNANCNCLRSYYYPICGGNGIQYFSPCYAGCTNSVSKRHPKVYYNCSCIERKTEVTPTPSSFSFEAQAGKCSSQCKNLPVFLGIFFAAIVFTFMAGTPITVSILRCVNQKQRSLALGIQCMLLRLLGTIPGPIIFGITIDSTCILWDINECGIKGACWIYNNIKMAYMLVAISVTCKIITVFFNGLAVFLYKPPPLGTDVPFQTQNSVVTTVSLECDLSKAGHDG